MLWHAHLETLGGFYQSDVYVASANRQCAIHDACEAIAAWQEDTAKQFLSGPLVATPLDDDYEEELAAWMKAVRVELKEKIVEVEAGVMVRVRS